MTQLQFLELPDSLPSIPRTVALLLTELGKEDPALPRVGELIGQDPMLTARILKLANSARYQFPQQVATVPEALSVLGLIEVRELVMAAALSSAFRQVGGINLEQFWRYSLNTAKLTHHLYGPGRTRVTAFTVGLVHAVGELVMHRGMEQKIQALNQAVDVFSPRRAQAEMERFGFSYAQVGAAFARAWNLPDALVEILECQADPFERNSYEPLAGFVHIAAWRCRAQEMGYSDVDLAETFPDAAALALGLDMEVLVSPDPIPWTSAQEAEAMT